MDGQARPTTSAAVRPLGMAMLSKTAAATVVAVSTARNAFRADTRWLARFVIHGRSLVLVVLMATKR